MSEFTGEEAPKKKPGRPRKVEQEQPKPANSLRMVPLAVLEEVCKEVATQEALRGRGWASQTIKKVLQGVASKLA